jgi:hypothetical protein
LVLYLGYLAGFREQLTQPTLETCRVVPRDQLSSLAPVKDAFNALTYTGCGLSLLDPDRLKDAQYIFGGDFGNKA